MAKFKLNTTSPGNFDVEIRYWGKIPKSFKFQVGLVCDIGDDDVIFSNFLFPFQFRHPRWDGESRKSGRNVRKSSKYGCRNRCETKGWAVKHSCSFVWKVQVAGRWRWIGCENAK